MSEWDAESRTGLGEMTCPVIDIDSKTLPSIGGKENLREEKGREQECSGVLLLSSRDASQNGLHMGSQAVIY